MYIYVPYKLVGLLYAGCEYGDRYPDECRRGRDSLCYHDDYRARCCATCAAKRGPLAHCEFGDRTSWCPTIPASQCYDDEDNCCETCHNYKTGKPGIGIGLSVVIGLSVGLSVSAGHARQPYIQKRLDQSGCRFGCGQGTMRL